MDFAAGLSEHPIAVHAVGEAVGQVLDRLGPGAPPDLAVLFTTAPHAGPFEDVASAVRSMLRPGSLIGATAVSVLGGNREVEDEPAVVVWAARFDEPVIPVRVDAHRTDTGWVLGGVPEEAGRGARTLVLVPDPFTFPSDSFVAWAAARYPELTVAGGMASAARRPGANRLALDGAIHADGAVGALLPPGVTVTPVVSQGCRPIGDPMIVTRSERNMLYELAGRTALDRLVEVIEGLGPDDRELARDGLHIGVVVDERQATFDRGDFLVRNVVGVDRDAGSLAVGAEVEVGSTVQFHVRDAATADEDLRSLLGGRRAAGALVFTCNGRGVRLFGTPDHDAEVVNAIVDGGATAGMFCAGELGRVGTRSFVHGFTASVLLFQGPS